jgi:hypothetical protein
LPYARRSSTVGEREPLTATAGSYRSNRFWTWAVIVVVGLNGLRWLLLLTARSLLRHVISFGGDLSAPVPQLLDQMQALLSRGGVASFVVGAITFLVWLHRAFANLPAVGSTATEIGAGLPATPATAVRVWFIPLANAVLGYMTVRHLWRESQPTPPLLPDGTRARLRAPLVAWWWAFYLVRIPLVTWANDFHRLRRYVDPVQDWVAVTERLGPFEHRDLVLRIPTPPATDQLR